MTRSLLLVAVAALAVSAVLPLRADDRSTVPPRRALTSSVSELDVDNVALSKVINFLRDSSGTNIFVNWKALEAANVTRDTPVSLRVNNLSLSKLLRLVLDQSAGNAALVYTVDEGVIEITTQDDADKRLITRVYIVDDLVMPTNKNSIQPVQMGLGATQNAGGSSGGGGGGGAQGIFGNPGGGGGGGGAGAADQTAEIEKAGQDLVKLIMDTIRPTIWKDNGGNASIRYFQGKLIVTAPISVQEAIGGPVASTSRRYGF